MFIRKTIAPLNLKKADTLDKPQEAVARKSPAFVIDDSPLKMEVKGSTTSKEDIRDPKSIGKKLSTGGVFFKDSTPLAGTPNSKNTFGSADLEEEVEEEEESDEALDMESYLKSLEKKA